MDVVAEPVIGYATVVSCESHDGDLAEVLGTVHAVRVLLAALEVIVEDLVQLDPRGANAFLVFEDDVDIGVCPGSLLVARFHNQLQTFSHNWRRSLFVSITIPLKDASISRNEV